MNFTTETIRLSTRLILFAFKGLEAAVIYGQIAELKVIIGFNFLRRL